MTSLQIISDVRNIASSGPAAVDFRISDAQILFWVNEVRSMLIVQALQKRQDISDIWLQNINCIPLTEVDVAECCDIVSDCYILRSVDKLPSTIETADANTMIKVAGIDGTSIAKINSFRSRFRAYNKFIGKTAAWFMKNDYLYITNTSLELGVISVTGLFEDPGDLSRFISCSNTPCYTLESQYPASLKMANEITNYIIQTKVKPYMLTNQDQTNDKKDETRPLGSNQTG
jgi:hypothetical protein